MAVWVCRVRKFENDRRGGEQRVPIACTVALKPAAFRSSRRTPLRERTQAGLAAARRVGRTGGRPPKLTDDDIEAAKAMLPIPISA